MLYKIVLHSGFGTFWYELTEDAFIKHSYVHHQEHCGIGHRHPFSLQDIQASFRILICGYIIAFTVFLVEKCFLTPTNLCKLNKIIWPVDSVMKDFESKRFEKHKRTMCYKRRLNISQK